MEFTKSEIITRIRLILDEIGLNESDFETGNDEQDLDTLIEGFALEALRFVNIGAPRELLAADAKLSTYSNNYSSVEGVIKGTEIGVFSDVKKFLRLVCVRCSAWSKPVYDIIKEGTPTWDKLSNRYLTGTVEDPMVSVGKSPTDLDLAEYDNAEIRLYCLPKANKESLVAEVYYMEQPSWREDKLRVSYLLQDAFHYYLAYLVLMALGDQRASIALQQAYPLMGLKKENDD